jgi:3-oxoacyl-[acyl-carrier-protein] synthase II
MSDGALSRAIGDETCRVVITGLGIVSSIGFEISDFVAGLKSGHNSAKAITCFDTTGFDYANGCEIDEFDPARLITNIPVGELGRASQFSAAAARTAVMDSGLTDEELRLRRCQISVGTTGGESRDIDSLMEQQVQHGWQMLDMTLARRIPAGRLSVAIARELGLPLAEATTIATACSAGNYSVGNGYDAIRVGDADIVLCGGADAMSRSTFTSFYRLGTIAPDCCRPFDRDRQGILTGEGAGVMVLERLESALARNAKIYAEVLGYGLTCDASHPVAPDQASVARCISLALQDAGVKPHEVDLISAHGTGTKANDVTEVRAIRDIYGESAPRTISLKSMLGHTMGAASALAAIACCLAITYRFIPPTINHRITDPDCEIDCVPNVAIDADLRIVQNNGLAFGGNNAVVVFGRYDEGLLWPSSLKPSQLLLHGPRFRRSGLELRHS